jgi:hypothetical protein
MGFDVIIINLILAVPVFFLCRLLFRKIIDDSKRRRLTWITTIVLTPLLYASLIFMLIAVVSYYPKRNFDKDKWRADVETRYEMTDDLVDNQKLIGKTREEVSELLGENGVNPNGLRWTYYIGFKPGLIRIDPDVLEIEFKDDRVSACWTHGT